MDEEIDTGLRYEKLSVVIKHIMKNKISMLDDRLKNRQLHNYMVVHSVFDIDDWQNDDWLVMYMVDKLYPTDEQVAKILRKPRVPEEIAELLVDFNVESVGMTLDPITIQYGMWEKLENGKMRDPIHIEDEIFDKKEIFYQNGKQVNIGDIIRNIPDIDVKFNAVNINEDIDCVKIFQ